MRKPKSTDKLVNKSRRNNLLKLMDTTDHPPILERPPYKQELSHQMSQCFSTQQHMKMHPNKSEILNVKRKGREYINVRHHG